MASVFISYKRKPSAILATLIARILREQSIEVYLDIQRMDTAGSFPTRLLDAIRECDVFVCLIGEETFDSEWVREEIQAAHKLGKPMIPVFQESYEQMPLGNAPTPYIKALLEYDGIMIFDIKNVYVDQSIDTLARMIENTASWLRKSETLTAPTPPEEQSLLGANIKDLAGQQFGQYELRQIIGVGGMGAVYRARQTSLNRDVALKVLPPTFAAQAGYTERFTREAQTAAALEHAHIVPVYDYGSQGGIHYVVMRLLTGGSLSDRLNLHNEQALTLPSLAEVSEVVTRLGSALDYAHSRGVIHRDIKASNVMFDEQGSPFLVDFGIAKLMGATSSLTGTGIAMGTPSYMAPEQWRGESVTPKTDQYALGVLLYMMVTGRMPFEAPTPYALMHKHLSEEATPPQVWRSGLPDSVKAVLDRAMAKDPRDRFASVNEMATEFNAAIAEVAEQPTGFFVAPLPRPQPRADAATGDGPTVTPSEPVISMQTPGSAPVAPGVESVQPVLPVTPTPPPAPEAPARPLSVIALTAALVFIIGLALVGGVALLGLQPGGFLTALAATETSTPTETPTPTEVVTVTPSTPIARAIREITVRAGPSADFDAVISLAADMVVDIVGISEDGAWYQIRLPEGVLGWLASSEALVSAAGNLASVPIVSAPTITPPPTETSTSTFTPTATETPTFTPSPTETSTSTFTPSPTETPTFTPSPTETLTFTPSPTETPTFTPSPTETPTATSTATATPTPATPIAHPLRSVIVRAGPGSQYPSVGMLNADEHVDILGISEDGAWYQVRMADDVTGWITTAGALVEAFGPLRALPVAAAPTDTPTFTPTATSTPSLTPTSTITPELPTARPTLNRPPASPTVAVRSCPGALPSRLTPGGQGRVLEEDPRPVNVRSGPATTFPRVGQLAIRSTFDVVDGPVCANGFAWFRIIYGTGFEGWVAEGDASYFVEPVASPSASAQPVLAGTRVLGPGCVPLVEDEFRGGVSANDWFIDTRADVPSNERIVDDFYDVAINRLTPGLAEATSWGSLRGRVFRDKRVEAVITADRFSSTPTRTGLWLRYQDENNFLAFMIASTGRYRIARYQNSYTDLVGWTSHPAIRTGDGAINTLRIDVRDDLFEFYINGQFADRVRDTTWAEGRIAFWGSTPVVPARFFLDYLRVCPN